MSKYIPNMRVHYFDIRRTNVENSDFYVFELLSRLEYYRFT
jgi:hypothetical protein